MVLVSIIPNCCICGGRDDCSLLFESRTVLAGELGEFRLGRGLIRLAKARIRTKLASYGDKPSKAHFLTVNQMGCAGS